MHKALILVMIAAAVMLLGALSSDSTFGFHQHVKITGNAGEPVRGAALQWAFMGAAGGHDEAQGFMHVNYREFRQICVYFPGEDGTFEMANGMAVLENWESSCGGTATLMILDRSVVPEWPRGAVKIDATIDQFDIMCPENPDGWCQLKNGNAIVFDLFG